MEITEIALYKFNFHFQLCFTNFIEERIDFSFGKVRFYQESAKNTCATFIKCGTPYGLRLFVKKIFEIYKNNKKNLFTNIEIFCIIKLI